MSISAQCNRVPVIDGHLECVFVGVENPVDAEMAVKALEEYVGMPQKLMLPSAPKNPVIVRRENNRPQPRLDKYQGEEWQESRLRGMAVSVGRFRHDSCDDDMFDYRFVVLSHNTIRGAAGGAILNAELLEMNQYMR